MPWYVDLTSGAQEGIARRHEIHVHSLHLPSAVNHRTAVPILTGLWLIRTKGTAKPVRVRREDSIVHAYTLLLP